MATKQKYAYEPDYAVPPGETLQETMDAVGMSQKELAIRTGLTVQSLVRILKGEQPLTYETANRLELATGVPARLWNNLEANYREQLTKLSERERMRANLEWLKTIPVKELQARGHVGEHDDKVLVLRDVLAFYGVSSVEAWRQIWETPAVAARRSRCFETCPGAASAWIRQGELQTQEIECEPYDKTKFREVLREVRALTREEPGVIQRELRRLCAEAGVAVAFVREMKKVPWNGVTRWITPRKAMILLSLRGKGEDKLWFSFFHEAGHVLLHSKKDLYINSGHDEDVREEEADEFGAESLIPERYNPRIRAIRSKAEVLALADELGIAPGIVAGRYEHLTKQWEIFSGLIRRFNWKPAA
jgi:plasmid maintenance system antidote protein VapI